MPDDDSSSFERDRTVAYQLFPDAMRDLDDCWQCLEANFESVSSLFRNQGYLFPGGAPDEFLLIPEWPTRTLCLRLRYDASTDRVQPIQIVVFSPTPMTTVVFSDIAEETHVGAAAIEPDRMVPRRGNPDDRSKVDFTATAPEQRWITWQDL